MNLPGIPKSTTIRISLRSGMFGDVDDKGDFKPCLLEGDFKVHKPSLDELSAAAAEVPASVASVPAVHALFIALGELKYVIDVAPEWWAKVVEAQDAGVIMAVYNEYSEWRRSPFRYAALRARALGETQQ